MKRSITVSIWLLILLIGCSNSDERYTIQLTQKKIENQMGILTTLYKELLPEDLDLKALNKVDNQIILFNKKGNYLGVSGVKCQDINIGRSKFRLGLIDGNNDGTYNQISEDGLFLGRYKEEKLFIDDLLDNVGYFKKRNQFSIDGNVYEILSISEDGRNIEFGQPIEKEETYQIAKYDSLLPRLSLEDRNGKKIQLWKLLEKDKKLLVVISNSNNQNEVQSIENELSRYVGKLKVILLTRERNLDDIKGMSDPQPIEIYSVGSELCDYELCEISENRNVVMLVQASGLIEEQRRVELGSYLRTLELQ